MCVVPGGEGGRQVLILALVWSTPERIAGGAVMLIPGPISGLYLAPEANSVKRQLGVSRQFCTLPGWLGNSPRKVDCRGQESPSGRLAVAQGWRHGDTPECAPG